MALLREAFRRPSWRGDVIALSGNTDCYQPLEAGWKLTRGCLEVCERFENPVVIVTKSQLVRRDADGLIPELADRNWIFWHSDDERERALDQIDAAAGCRGNREPGNERSCPAALQPPRFHC